MITKLKHATRVTTLWLKQPICFYSVVVPPPIRTILAQWFYHHAVINAPCNFTMELSPGLKLHCIYMVGPPPTECTLHLHGGSTTSTECTLHLYGVGPPPIPNTHCIYTVGPPPILNAHSTIIKHHRTILTYCYPYMTRGNVNIPTSADHGLTIHHNRD